jgi:hypothetical protein
VALNAGLDTSSPRVGALAAAFVHRMESPSDWDTADTVAIADLVQASFVSAAVMALSEAGRHDSAACTRRSCAIEGTSAD